MGAIYTLQKEYSKAVHYFKKSLETNPKYESALLNLGMIYEILGRFPEAIKTYKKLLDINPKQTDAMFSLGWVLMDEHRYLEAAPFFKRAVHLNPAANTYYGLGMVYNEMGRNEDALLQFRKALQMDGNHAGAHEKIALLEKEFETKTMIKPRTRRKATSGNSDIILVP